MRNISAKELVKEMKIGWSLGNTLDSVVGADVYAAPAISETGWGNLVTTKEMIQTVINKGFNVIRIPVSWNDHIFMEDNYKIEEGWMNRIQEVVDYAYNLGAFVILNTHHESWYYPYFENEEKGSKMLEAIWVQIAERFKDYDEHLIFEGMNEPRKVGTEVEWNGGDEEGWEMVNRFNQVFVKTIRNLTDGNNPKRMLMIPGYAASCWEALKHIEVPQNDDKLIVSVHAYEPYRFALDTKGTGLWNHATENIDAIMKSLEELFLSKNIPVVIGEFGALHKEEDGNEEERAAWATYYIAAAKKIGVPCVWWDNALFKGRGECFGLLDRGTLKWKYQKVVEGLFKGLE